MRVCHELAPSHSFGMTASFAATRGLQQALKRTHRRVACASRLSIVSSSAAAEPAVSPQWDANGAPHLPVLLQEVLEQFAPVRLKTYVDGTLGAGGHATAVLQAHQELEVLVGIDLDPTAHALAKARLAAVERPGVTMHFMRGNYSDAKRFLQQLPVPQQPSSTSGEADPASASRLRGVQEQTLFGRVDGMLLDLGVSSMQLDTAERGFSFMHDGPLDMRMDPGARLSAEEVVNTWSEAELGRIIRDYGEEKMWRQVARRIVAAREQAPITHTRHLVQAIGSTRIQGGKQQRKGSEGGSKGIHPATRTFQALRIAVNDELGKLEQALPAAIECLAPGGRLAVISFHSLEDRLVKHAFARACGRPTPEDEEALSQQGPGRFAALDMLEARAVARPVTRKPVVAGETECAANPRARSAKLRVIERLGPAGVGAGAGQAGGKGYKGKAKA